MALKRKTAPRLSRAFTAARRRALARLRNGIDLQWTRPKSRDDVHKRADPRLGE